MVGRTVGMLTSNNIMLCPASAICKLKTGVFSGGTIEEICSVGREDFLGPFSVLIRSVRTVSLITGISVGRGGLFCGCLPKPCAFVLNGHDVIPHSIADKLGGINIEIPSYKVTYGLTEVFPVAAADTGLSSSRVLSGPGRVLRRLSYSISLMVSINSLSSDDPSSVISLSKFGPEVIEGWSAGFRRFCSWLVCFVGGGVLCCRDVDWF